MNIQRKKAIVAAAKLTKNKELVLVEKEQNLIDQRKILQEDLENSSKMLDEGNSRLEATVTPKTLLVSKWHYYLLKVRRKNWMF